MVVLLRRLKELIRDTNGDAVVEATILFPIMIMIFAALVLLAMYLPQRAVLQEAAQRTATLIAAQASDTYIAFDNDGARRALTSDELKQSVYVAAVRGIMGSDLNAADQAYQIASNTAQNAVMPVSAQIDVQLSVKNYIVYQELTVRLTQTVPMPVDLSFIGFPTELVLTQEASAMVQNGDEFIRNIDIAKDMVVWLDSKLKITESLSGALGKVKEVLNYFHLGGG